MKKTLLCLFAITALLSASAISALATDGTWTLTTTGGTWGTATNWSGNTIATGAGATANFTGTYSNPDTIQLDNAYTLGALNFSPTNTTTLAFTIGNNGNAANTLTLDNSGSPATITVTPSTTSAIISANVNVVNGLTKAGTGNVTFSGSVTYTGTTTVSGGSLIFKTASNVTLNGISGTGIVSSTGSGVLTVEGNNTGFTGSVSISGTGATIQAVDTAANYSGTTPTGSLVFGTGTSPSATVLNISNATNATVQLRVNGDGTSNSQTISLMGATQQILGSNTVSTTFNVDRFSSGGGTNKTIELGNLNISLGPTINVTGADGYNLEFAKVTLGGSSPSANNPLFDPTTANLIINSWSITNNDSPNIRLDGTSSGNIAAGGITNNTNTGSPGGTTSVTKQNTSTWTLTGASTYSGGTSVTGGTLLVTNTSGSATGAGALSVSSLGTIGGTGTITSTTNTINGNVLVGQTSAADHNTTSTLNMIAGTSTTFAGANLSFNLNTTAGGVGNSNTLALGSTSSVIFNGTNTLTFNLQGGTTIANNTVYDLFTDTLTGTSPFSGTGYNVDGTGKITGLTLVFDVNGVIQTMYGSSFLQLSGNNINLDVVVATVPEPGTWALMLGGLALLVIYQRSRRSSKI